MHIAWVLRIKSYLSALVVLLILSANALAAERYAVVIGVSEYPSLPKSAWLRGPKNDARLVSEFLVSNPGSPFKRENIIVLADGVDGAKLPSLAEIRIAMQTTATRAEKGDFIYLHFSGHGTQAPASEESGEIDGLNELFLPRDIGRWNDQVGEVKNALVDDEIGQMINKIRAKGAFVWAVFDSCHSGTVTRGSSGNGDIRLRKVLPEILNIPDAAMNKAMESVPRTRGQQNPQREMTLDIKSKQSGESGGFVAFYAAQTTETTPEMRLPKGKKGRKSQGLFTFTLFQVLAEYPGISYRQLGQEILRRYGSSYLAQPTPLYEGDLDRLVLGSSKGKRISQWTVVVNDDETLSLPAGALHGLQEGGELLLLPAASSANSAAIGIAKITEIETLLSIISVTDTQGKPFENLDAFENGVIARKKNVPLEFSLTVAKPDLLAISDTDQKEKAAKILESIEGKDDEGLRISFVEPGKDADLRLILSESDGASPEILLWFAPPTGQLVQSGAAKTPSISLFNKSGEAAIDAIRDNFTRIARATNLLKLGVASGISDNVEIGLRTKRKGANNVTDLDTASVPLLFPGDIVHVLIKNTSEKPVDINVLYVGSDYSITHMYYGRVHPGDSLKKRRFKVNDKSFGSERILIVTTPAKPQTAVEDLSFLAQSAVPATRGAAGFRAMLREAGFGQTSRDFIPLDDEEEEARGGIRQILFEIAPRKQ